MTVPAASTGQTSLAHRRLLPVRPEDLRAHTAAFGGLPSAGGLIETVRRAGLTGRGGAGFPAYRKLAAVREAGARGRQPVVLANAAETEPASDKDATLLWVTPHLVLDGVQLAAAAVGAGSAVIYVSAALPGRPRAALNQALAARAGLDRVPVRLAEASPRFLAGQETAAVRHLNGGPAVPGFSLTRVTERGVANGPTLVHNVETLAHLALIARRGAGWYRSVGTTSSPGTTLITLHRTEGSPRVVEVSHGTRLGDLLARPGDGLAKAVLVGGYHGTWLPADLAYSLRLDARSLESAGASLGGGVVLALPADRCGLAESARVVRYLALESAGQCGPCLNGLPSMAGALAELAGPRPRNRTIENVHRWAGLVAGRGACHHPDGTARFVRSALTVFSAELALHRQGRCSATDRRPFLPVPSSASTARTEADWR